MGRNFFKIYWTSSCNILGMFYNPYLRRTIENFKSLNRWFEVFYKLNLYIINKIQFLIQARGFGDYLAFHTKSDLY